MGTAREPLVGRVLRGKWRVEQKLGEGGTSTVYRAVHRNGQRVAVKVLADRWALDERARGRFLREGYVANKVGHDGAVTIFDDDVDDGVVFLVMELLEGETLSARLAGRPTSFDEVLDVGERVLEILAAAHVAGVVHRDVKPSNVFLTGAGVVKLLDFGLAHVEEDPGATTTATGTMMGTPAFMAPEQARGRWKDVDARTDLWAVGATLFAALSGRHVHRGSTANEVVIAAATQPAPLLTSIVPAAPADVAAVVDRALSFAPEDRWVDANAMLDALRAARAGKTLAIDAPRPATADDGSATAPESTSQSALISAATARPSVRRGASRRTLAASLSAIVAIVVAVVLARHGFDRTTVVRTPTSESKTELVPSGSAPPAVTAYSIAESTAVAPEAPPPSPSSSPLPSAAAIAPPSKPLVTLSPKGAATVSKPETPDTPAATPPLPPLPASSSSSDVLDRRK